MENDEVILKWIGGVVGSRDRSAERIKRIAEVIRSVRGYRWVGIYEVTNTEIAAIAWTGTEVPAYPRFPISQGLCGAAVKSRVPIVVGDVRNDPRYLTTFGSTQSEIVVPVKDATGKVVGLIDVERERPNAFQDEDTRFLRSCASAILPMFQEGFAMES